MLKEYLDINGLTYLWSKLKTKFSSATNWLNGSATGSVRTVRSAEENGEYTIGSDAVAEGEGTKASGNGSHSEGLGSVASGNYSHAGGAGTIAQRRSQTAIGEYNVVDAVGADKDSRGKYAFIIGNGDDENNRSNAFTVDWSGNLDMSGNLSIKNTTVADYVVEQGTKSGGYYRYWNSGKAEFWRRVSASSGLTTTAWTAPIYYHDSTFSAAWSGVFNSAPSNVYTVSHESQVFSVYCWSANQNGGTFRLLTCGAKSNIGYAYEIYAIGTWK